MEKENIILIGMPGCGKSTCGVLIAKTLCKRFLDTDLLIQSQEGAALQEILDTRGYDYFAKAEESVLSGLILSDYVIATGGSAVYYPNAMAHLKQNGLVIYLRVSLQVMMERIKNIKTRGILLKPGETMQEMFQEREQLYTQYADLTIDCDLLTAEETVNKIYHSLQYFCTKR